MKKKKEADLQKRKLSKKKILENEKEMAKKWKTEKKDMLKAKILNEIIFLISKTLKEAM